MRVPGKGERYRVAPAFGGMIGNKVVWQVGKVWWVHPRGRYAVLVFDGVAGRLRECFPPDDLEGKRVD